MGIQWSVSCGWKRKGVLVNFLLAMIKIPDKDNFREQRFIWHRLWWQEVVAAGVWGGWSHCVQNEKAENEDWSCSTNFFSFQIFFILWQLFLLLLLLLNVYGCFMCACLYTMSMTSSWRSQKGPSHPLELESQMDVGYHDGAGNWTLEDQPVLLTAEPSLHW